MLINQSGPLRAEAGHLNDLLTIVARGAKEGPAPHTSLETVFRSKGDIREVFRHVHRLRLDRRHDRIRLCHEKTVDVDLDLVSGKYQVRTVSVRTDQDYVNDTAS